MNHITTELLEQAEKDLSPSKVYGRMKAHLVELCLPCKRAFQEHQLSKLREQPKKWILEPLHTVELPLPVAEQIQVLRQMSPEQRFRWAERPWGGSQQLQPALLLGLLLEARNAIEAATVAAWARLAARFRRQNPVTTPANAPLQVLIAAYQAEGYRRKGKNHLAAKHLRQALELAEAQAVTDDVARAELHFIAGKICFTDRRQIAEAEDHLSKAALLYAALGDESRRAHCLVYQSVAMRRLDSTNRLEIPFGVPVELILEALAS